MGFLRNLTFLGLLVSLMAAAPSDREQKAAAEQTVTCGGVSFTNNEVIGNDNGNIIVKILNGRIYLERNGTIAPSIQIIYAADNNHSLKAGVGPIAATCINAADPSTSTLNYLGVQSGNTITCNGKAITDNVWLSYWPEDTGISGGHDSTTSTATRTYNVPRIVDGFLRIDVIRKETPNIRLSRSDLGRVPNDNWSVLQSSLDYHFVNPAYSFNTLTATEVAACFYPSAPKYPDAPASSCTTAPVIASSGISNITTGSLTVSFSASTSAQSINWVIKDGSSSSVRSGNATVNGGTSANITYTALSPGSYTLEVQGGNCTSSVSSQSFNVPRSPCTDGPRVFGNVTNISSTGLTFQFDGIGVGSVDWRILNSSSASVASGSISPVTTSTNTISFSSLSDGNYTLEIQGGSTCSSVTSTKDFTIGSVGPCSTAPVIASSGISNISATGLTVTFTAANSAQNVNWVIKNGSSTIVASGNKITNGASSAALTFSSLANGTYTLEVQGGSCTSSVSSQQFTINVSKPACTYGPVIEGVSGITANGLTFTFNGLNVGSIDWRILSGSNVLRTSSASIVPTNGTPSLSFSPGLTNGPYTLEIQGGYTCSSTPSTFGFTVSNSSLPINVAGFKADAKKEGVELSWSVVSEYNGQGFEVLRYDDQVKSPRVIANIPLTEARIGDYRFLDEAPENGNNYYQLKQVDTDGTFALSRVVTAKFEQLYKMFIAPNPAKEFVDVEFESRIAGTAVFDIYNISGIRVHTSKQKVKAGLNRVKVNIEGLVEGNYILKVQEQKESHSLRFLKLNN